MNDDQKSIEQNGAPKKAYQSPDLKKYSAPKLNSYGGLREVSKGQAAYSLNEGFFQDFANPSQ